MEDAEIERRLTEAQAAVLADVPRKQRREAVMEALAAGWTKYRIAAVLGVKGATVNSIIETAKKESAR